MRILALTFPLLILQIILHAAASTILTAHPRPLCFTSTKEDVRTNHGAQGLLPRVT